MKVCGQLESHGRLDCVVSAVIALSLFKRRPFCQLCDATLQLGEVLRFLSDSRASQRYKRDMTLVSSIGGTGLKALVQAAFHDRVVMDSIPQLTS